MDETERTPDSEADVKTANEDEFRDAQVAELEASAQKHGAMMKLEMPNRGYLIVMMSPGTGPLAYTSNLRADSLKHILGQILETVTEQAAKQEEVTDNESS